jgi:hypothetical protein
MSDDPGELSPSTSPASTASSSSSPSSSPTFEQRRAAQPTAPREREPAAPNPRAERPSHWSDKHTAEGGREVALRHGTFGPLRAHSSADRHFEMVLTNRRHVRLATRT